jgi:exosortase A-associated hydrolase 1
MNESAIVYACGGEQQVGIFHPAAGEAPRRGVVIVVGGGPQYRVGGHRQLVLWSRRLAREGYPVFRFDYRGMGDSHGRFAGFEDVDDDIARAIDQLMAQAPSVREVVLWGECDAAAAILFYAYRDVRVKGLVLLNPWARTEAGQAKTVLRHYYLRRLMEPSFWRKVISLRFNPAQSMGSAVSLLAKSRAKTGTASGSKGADWSAPLPRDMALPDMLYAGYSRFDGPVMLVMSGRDLIAREFDELVRGSERWDRVFAAKPTTRHDVAEGDHTFSSAEQRESVIVRGLGWLKSIQPDRRGA